MPISVHDAHGEREQFKKWYHTLSEDGELLYAGRLLSRASREFGDSIAFLYKDQTITFAQLYDRVCSFVPVLKKHDVQKGDRVLICFENTPEFYIAYFAVWQAGAVVIPVNTFLRETELGHIVHDAQPKVIITATDRVPFFSGTQKSILTEQDMSQSAQKDEDCIDLSLDEACILLYTSGTTGVPKGVMLSSRAIVTNVLQSIVRLNLASVKNERLFAVLPLFHVFAQNTCIWAVVITGVTVILVPKIDRRLILQNLQHKPTFFLGVPALYGLLCLLKTAPLDSVNYFISGGDALPDKIRAAFGLIYRRKICSGYGLTETGPVISVDLEDETGPTGIVGMPVVDVQCMVRDPEGNDLPQGSIGLLWVKGPNLMLGYYNEPELTHATLQNGWFNTGDLGYITRKGKIVITGREKDLIIHKGFNIYPQEIENIILLHPTVIRVGVVQKKDPETGEIPIAFVQLRTAEDAIEEKLKSLCLHHLASYKVPRQFICTTEELPVTATGKVDKKVLRKMVDEGREIK